MSDPHIDIDDVDEIELPKVTPIADDESSGDEQFIDFDKGTGAASTASSKSFLGWQKMPDVIKTVTDQLGAQVGVNIRQSMDEILPEETREHFRAAQREFLLGWRTLIDRQLERLEAQGELDHARQSAPAKTAPLKIEFSED